MFTGIIEHIGTIAHVRNQPGGRRLRVDIGPLADQGNLGDSLSINGVCLTASSLDPPFAEFDVIQETLARTALGSWSAGDRVNLERSLSGDGRIHGHFVQGHIDGVATVSGVVSTAKEHVLWLSAPADLRAYLIPKGSVALDGVSLTIAALDADRFSVALIPTTLEHTTLGQLRESARVNVETDMIVRTVVHQLSTLTGAKGLTLDTLQKAGFA